MEVTPPFTPAPIKPTVSVGTLDALDVRVGTISQMEEVPGSERLVRLTVDFGSCTRRIVAGMRKERADPTEVRGRQALFVVNVEPRRIRGELSEGMLFDIGHADGILPVLAVPERPVPNGVRAG
jgi:methionine--tRNA ligase beta chain